MAELTWEEITRFGIRGFQEAADWLAGKSAVTKEEYNELGENARRKAFTVSNVASADLIQQILDALVRTIREGGGLSDFQEKIGEQLKSSWVGTKINAPWRLEVIYRTNVQQAYSAGRMAQMASVSDAMPYWVYDAVLDVSTTELCRRLNGTVLPAGDPFWWTHTPPMHYCCRSGLRPLTAEQARGRVGFGQPLPDLPPAEKGFGVGQIEWRPDISGYSEGLREAVGNKLESQP